MISLTCLTPEEIQQIHHASLRILDEVGILIDDPFSRQLLLDHGAHPFSDRLCLPPDLVQGCLASCPSLVEVQGRGGSIVLGDGALHVHNLGGARDVLDRPGGEIRPAVTADVAQSTRLLDALPSVSTITPLYTPRDVPARLMALTMFDQMVRNTLKPISSPGISSTSELQSLFAMMQVIFGNKPSIPVSVSPLSPLTFSGHIAPAILEVARLGLPFAPLPCPNVGATSPMSLAGAVAQQNAENLAAIVLAQLVSPGLPIVYCGRLSVLSMRSGAPLWGNPEVGLMSAATVQVGHFYHLPVNVYGLAASGYASDMQAGYERVVNALVPALAGADELSGVGEMAGGALSSNFQMLIDDDIFAQIRRVLRGFSVNEDSLAVEVIAHAMAGTRNFMAEKHTRQYLRAGELWQARFGIPEVGWEMWRAAGSPDVLRRAQIESENLLSSHEVPPILDTQAKELDRILAQIQ
jgi:trimethylamine--corrinoid protein Co-methyltransferase